MKRLNPKTKQPYRFGDTENNMVFYNYRTDLLAGGFRGERWLSEDAFKKAVQRDLAAKAKKRRQAGKQIRVTKITTVHV